MTVRFTEEEAVAAVAALSRRRLVRFVEAELVTPVQTENGPAYHRLDLARLELMCELSDHFDLNSDALAIVMGLVDQLHGVRAELRCVLEAIEAEPPEVRARLAEAIDRARHG